MEFRELRSLVALAESNSITLTAEKLCLSPSAIHKQLKSLEEELGVQLYEMVGRQLRLTQATEMMLPYLKEMLAQYDSALAILKEWSGMRRGLVRIGAGPTLSSYILPEILKRFRRVHPSVELIVETGNTPVLLERLGSGSLDLALLVSSDLLEGPAFSIEASWDFEMVLVSHRRQSPVQCRITDLKSSPFILFRKESRLEEPIDRYFAAAGLQPRVIMRFDSAEAIKAMIRTGLGISMLPMWIVDEDLRASRLSLIRQQEPPLRSKIALVARKSGFVSKTVRAFIADARNVQWKTPRLTATAGPGRRRRPAAVSPGDAF
jgi:DNA-binding transcriptional LysR family regulator